MAVAVPIGSFLHEHSAGLLISTLGHAVLLLIVSISLVSLPSRVQGPIPLAIEATIVDEGAIRRAREQREREARLEQQRRDEERSRQQAEERRQREQVEQQRLATIEQQRKQEEQVRLQAEAEQRRKEQQEQERLARIEQQRQAEAERLQKAEEARQKAVREEELRVALAAEERLIAAERSGLLAQYIAVIRQKVERKWVKPASAGADLECIVHVTQIPGGEVVGVRLGQCNGDAVVVRSIEAAVYKSSPFPLPPEPALFERNLRFTFKPEQ